MSHLVFTIFQIPQEVGSNACGRMDLLARTKRDKAFNFFPCSLNKMLGEGVVQNKGGSSYFKDLN